MSLLRSLSAAELRTIEALGLDGLLAAVVAWREEPENLALISSLRMEVDLLGEIEQSPVDEPAWVLRTVRDVREGDVVRMPGAPDSERVAEGVSPVLDWHVHPAADPYHPERMPAEWSSVRIWGIAFDPAMPIEIKLTAGEVTAIEAIGWENRISTSS